MKKETLVSILLAMALVCAVLLVVALCIDSLHLLSLSSLIAMASAWAGSAINGKGVAL